MSSTARKYTNKNYVKHLFSENIDGYIQVIQIKGEKIVHIKNYKGTEIAEKIQDYNNIVDTFIAINTTYNGKRNSNNIRQLRALYLDLDYKNLTYNEVIQDTWTLAIQGEIPIPSMVVSSGRGVHIYWRIEDAPYQALATWQELEDFLYTKLKHLGADKKATDASRVLRLPDTINSKNNIKCEVTFINNEITHSMYDLREKYLKWKPRNLKKAKSKVNNQKATKKVVNLYTSYSLHIARAKDILTICKKRNYEVTGYRNFILHCYAYWIGVTVRDDKSLEEAVNELNNKFTRPLKQSEVNAILRCVPKAIDKFIGYEQGLRTGEDKRISKCMRDRGGYWYKNETLIERLDITREEMQYLITIIDEKEKYRRCAEEKKAKQRAKRRNKAGLTSREQQKQDLIKQIKKLKAKGLIQMEVAKSLDKSIRTIKQYWNL